MVSLWQRFNLYFVHFRDTSRDFIAKIPKVYFSLRLPLDSSDQDPGRPLKCELSLHNSSARMTSLLLRDYYDMDPRIHTLATAVR